MTDQPPTEQQLAEIETRAAHLFEYVTLPTEADQLAGVDVPLLLADLRRALDRVAELETYAHGCDAEGCVLPHSSWCEAAKKTAAANEGCTCGRPWSGHPQPHAMHCWSVNPPRAEVEEMRKRIAELTAAVSRDAASEAISAPLSASQPSSVSESAQSPTGAPEGAPRAPLPAEEFTGTQPCGHDDYHSPHPWADRPNVWCPGHSYDDDQDAAIEETP